MRINRTNPKTKKGVLWGNIKKCENEYKKIEQLEDKIDSLTSTKEEQIFIKNKTAKNLTKEFDKLTRFNRKLIDRLNELSPDINYNSRVSELSNSNESLHNSLQTMRISRSQPIVKKGYLWGDVKKCIQETEKIEELKNTIDGLYKEIKEEKKIKQETVKLLINNNKKLTKENNNLKSKIKNITQQRKIFGTGRGYNKTKKIHKY
jgi:DNA repair exonuclease SbcCD ATPase subunit